MNKFKLLLDTLLDVVSDIRSLADSLEALANALCDTDEETKATNLISEPKADKEPTLTKEDVRAVLSSKMKEHKDEIQALLIKYGSRKLSEIDPKHYAALLADAEVLK